MSKKVRGPRFQGTGAEELAWKALDQALFGDDPVEGFHRMMQWKQQQDEVDSLTLGTQLKRLRRERGLTPTQAAARSGLPATAWRNWEADHWIPSENDLQLVGSVLGNEMVARLSRLRPRAPLVLLRRALERKSLRQVARASGERRRDTLEQWRLRTENLDPAVRGALEGYLGVSELEAVARELERVSTLAPEEQERWVRLVAERVRL